MIICRTEPWFAVEVKSGDRKISKNLLYFGARLEIPLLYQLTTDPGTDYMEKGIRITSADRFLSSLI